MGWMSLTKSIVAVEGGGSLAGSASAARAFVAAMHRTAAPTQVKVCAERRINRREIRLKDIRTNLLLRIAPRERKARITRASNQRTSSSLILFRGHNSTSLMLQVLNAGKA